MENQRISTLLKLVANPERRAILFLLLDSEHSVPELAEAVGLSATSISNHLAKLRTEGVVDFTRYHRVIEYRLTSDATATLLRTLPDILAQSRQPVPQAADGISYAHKLHKAEARLDWHEAVATLERKIRAYNPTPIAHTTLDGEPLRIHAARVLNHSPAAAPGTITAHHEDGLDVACADGTLRITRLQLPGKTATDAAALRHSRDLTGHTLT